MLPPILLTRSHDSRRQTLAEYRAEGGYQTLDQDLSGEAMVAALERANLRGRGGAAFPVARKWAIAKAAQAAQKHFVANGGEHEPGSQKDRFLLARYPHKVLEGLLLGMRATGAGTGWLYVIEDMHEQVAALEAAIQELRGIGIVADLRIHKAPTTYVAGEETAALSSIEGKPAKPRKKPPYPGEAGIDGLMEDDDAERWIAGIVPALAKIHAHWADARAAQPGRVPAVDYDHGGALHEPAVRTMPKVGRNDPCPCGSGKKYKKCCMAKDTASA